MNVLRRCLESRLLGSVAGVCFVLWGFIEVAEEVCEGDTGALDRLARLSLLLKVALNRPLPDLFVHGEYVASASFPSGHAMLSSVVYLTIGALLAGLAPRRRLKIHVLGVALLLTVSIGVSRVYLGVHWPTDVLAGWAAGAAWAFGWWGVAEWFREDRR